MKILTYALLAFTLLAVFLVVIALVVGISNLKFTTTHVDCYDGHGNVILGQTCSGTSYIQTLNDKDQTFFGTLGFIGAIFLLISIILYRGFDYD